MKVPRKLTFISYLIESCLALPKIRVLIIALDGSLKTKIRLLNSLIMGVITPKN